MAARVRPTELADMRAGLDARGLAYGIADDVQVDRVSAAGVPAEWTFTPNADPRRVKKIRIRRSGASAPKDV